MKGLAEYWASIEIPKDLRRLLPSFIRQFVDWRVTLGAVGFLFGVFFYRLLNSSNIWVLFVPTGLGPFLAALLFAVHPYNPYQNLPAQRQGITQQDVERDPAAQRFLELLRSAEARRIALLTGFYTMTVLSLVMWILSVFRKQPIAIGFDVDQLGLLVSYTLLFSGASLGLQTCFLLRWAIRNYGK